MESALGCERSARWIQFLEGLVVSENSRVLAAQMALATVSTLAIRPTRVFVSRATNKNVVDLFQVCFA